MSLGSPNQDRVAGLDPGSLPGWKQNINPLRPEPAPKQSRLHSSLWAHLIASNYSTLPHPPAGEGLSVDPGVKGRGLGFTPCVKASVLCSSYSLICKTADFQKNLNNTVSKIKKTKPGN